MENDTAKYDEEIFDSMEEALSVMWWVVHLLGGKVTFPVEEDFWLENFPEQTRLVLRKENGKLVLSAESKQWNQLDD